MSEINELIASEIADFFAGFGGPGEPDVQSGEAQRLLTERVLSVLALRERAEPVAWVSDADKCDPDVFEMGVTACVVAAPKETAETICRGISAATGCKVDWHYVGGRVHIKVLRTAPPAPVAEDDSEIKWRELALQFDGHRMQAICFLKQILKEFPETEFSSAREFLKSGPLPGEEVLRNRIAALAPPAPVVPAETFEEWSRRCEIQLTLCRPEFREVAEITWNACRAAMLQPVSQPYKLSDGWIACSERLPEKDGNYWAWWSESKRQGPAWFIKSELQAQFQSSEITHWMPLPEAPGKDG
ncbi:DUF551 domain-containing protein [Cronobacter sakazakii]|nr:DUF551 domain-containing protein [Cronobacter sakazakii]